MTAQERTIINHSVTPGSNYAHLQPRSAPCRAHTPIHALPHPIGSGVRSAGPRLRLARTRTSPYQCLYASSADERLHEGPLESGLANRHCCNSPRSEGTEQSLSRPYRSGLMPDESARAERYAELGSPERSRLARVLPASTPLPHSGVLDLHSLLAHGLI